MRVNSHKNTNFFAQKSRKCCLVVSCATCLYEKKKKCATYLYCTFKSNVCFLFIYLFIRAFGSTSENEKKNGIK